MVQKEKARPVKLVRSWLEEVIHRYSTCESSEICTYEPKSSMIQCPVSENQFASKCGIFTHHKSVQLATVHCVNIRQLWKVTVIYIQILYIWAEG